MILGYISILYKHSTVFWCSTLLVLWGDPLYSELICGSQISHYYSIADTKTRLYSFNRHWFFMYIMLVEFPSKIVQWLRAYGALLIKTLLNQGTYILESIQNIGKPLVFQSVCCGILLQVHYTVRKTTNSCNFNSPMPWRILIPSFQILLLLLSPFCL